MLAFDKQEVGTLVSAQVWIWMCHYLVYRSSYNALNNCKIACYSTTMAMIYIRIRTDVDSIYGTVSCWLWTNRLYVGIGACLNLKVPLLGVRCNMTPSQLHTHLLLKYTTMAMTYGYALMLMLIEYMQRYRVGFGRTVCTLVLVHVWIRICHCLAYDALWHNRNCTLACYSTTMALCDVDWIYATVLYWLWTNRKCVGIGTCLNLTVSLLVIRCTI